MSRSFSAGNLGNGPNGSLVMRAGSTENLLFYRPGLGGSTPPALGMPRPPVLSESMPRPPPPFTSGPPVPTAPPQSAQLSSQPGYINIAPLLEISARLAAKAQEFQDLLSKMCEVMGDLNRFAAQRQQQEQPQHHEKVVRANSDCFVTPSPPSQASKTHNDPLQRMYQPETERRDTHQSHTNPHHINLHQSTNPEYAPLRPYDQQ